jgi:hypothetical protein
MNPIRRGGLHFIETETLHADPARAGSNVMLINHSYNMRYLRHRYVVFNICYKHVIPLASIHLPLTLRVCIELWERNSQEVRNNIKLIY